MRYLGILILLMFFTPIQAQQIGLVQTRSFYDRDHGLKQLLRSLEARNPSFFDLQTEARDQEFGRISSGCFQTENKQVRKEALCLVIDRIAASLEQFAKDHAILILIDLDYGKRKSGYTIMDGEHIGDITERFINHYNRNNP